MRELYEKMIAASKTTDEGLFVASARNWLAASEENPFNESSPAFDLYFKAKRCFTTWQSKAINYRNSKRQMIEYAKQLAALDLPSPYPEEKHEEMAQESVEEQHKEVVAPSAQSENVTHILGVIPENETKEAVVEQLSVEEYAETAETKSEQAPIQKQNASYEKKHQPNNPNDKHAFFGKRKK